MEEVRGRIRYNADNENWEKSWAQFREFYGWNCKLLHNIFKTSCLLCGK